MKLSLFGIVLLWALALTSPAYGQEAEVQKDTLYRNNQTRYVLLYKESGK